MLVSRAPIRLFVTLLAATLGSAVWGPGNISAPTVTAGPKASATLPETITIADTADLAHLDGTINWVTNHRRVYGHIYDALLTRDPRTQAVKPRLAESWKQEDDTIWTFTVRKGVRFHNGDPLDAETVKWSLERTQDPKLSQAASYVKLGTVTVVDDHRVRIVTRKPDPLLLTRVTDMAYIGSKKYFDGVGAEQFGLKPVGTGPYKFVEWTKGSHITLQANANYWGGPVPVKKVVFRVIPDASTRVAALLVGEVDIATDIPPALASRVIQSSSTRMSIGVDPVSIGVWLRPIGPLTDVKVRWALNHAVDKEAIVNTVWRGYATANHGPLFPGAFGFNTQLKPYPYDPPRAKRLLAEAGYPNGFEFAVDVPIGGVAQAQEVAEAVAGDLAKVDVRMKINTLEWGAFLKNLFTPKSSGMHEGFILYTKSAPLDADVILSASFRCDGVWPANSNFALYCNPRVDALLERASTTFDQKVRQRAMQAASKIIRDDAAWVFLYAPKALYGVRKGVPWEVRVDGMIFVWDDL